MAKQSITAIIPAAGKGTRMGSPVDGKEMMLDLQTGRPLIDFAILAAEDAGCDRIVVAIEKGTKPNLVAHIKATFPAVHIMMTKPEGEWPSTVLQTEQYWHAKNNVLILPDTRFNSQELKFLVERHVTQAAQISFALLPGKVMEPEKFGIVALHEYSNAPLYTMEKPTDVEWSNIAAWGLIAFDAIAGFDAFQAYKVRGKQFRVSNLKVQDIWLSWFKDITRNGHVEPY